MDAHLQRNPAATVGLSRRLRAGPIGLDFGTERVNLVQFTGGTQPCVQAAASVAYPAAREAVLADGAALARTIDPVLRRGGFRGRRVIAALPPGRVTLRFVPYRRTVGQDDGTAIVAALREQQADIANAVLDYLPIRPKSEEMTDRAALVAYAPRDEVVALLDVLRAARLDVRALEVGPVAIKRLLAAVHDQRDGNKIMSINFGGPASFVTVLWDRDLLLDRSIEFGMDAVLGTIEDALEVSTEEAGRLLRRYGIGLDPDLPQAGREFAQALLDILKPAFLRLAEQVKKVLVYTAAETRGGAIDRIYLLGSVARCAGVDRLLQAMVEVPVETINPFYGFDVASDDWQRLAREPLPGIAVSAGLALRGLLAHG
ncbi:MAG: pilus assembly protein PilM [Gammaproteobacteria bacterium]